MRPFSFSITAELLLRSDIILKFLIIFLLVANGIFLFIKNQTYNNHASHFQNNLNVPTNLYKELLELYFENKEKF